MTRLIVLHRFLSSTRIASRSLKTSNIRSQDYFNQFKQKVPTQAPKSESTGFVYILAGVALAYYAFDSANTLPEYRINKIAAKPVLVEVVKEEPKEVIVEVAEEVVVEVAEEVIEVEQEVAIPEAEPLETRCSHLP